MADGQMACEHVAAAMALFLAAFCGIASAAPGVTTTTLGVTVNGASVTSIAPGTTAVFTAAVTSGTTPVHPGTVRFCDATAIHCVNGALLGTRQLTSTGQASLALRLPSGMHSVVAVFAGTTSYLGSTSPAVPLTVTGTHATTTTLAYSGVQGNYTLTSKVSSSTGTGRAPTGTVSFLDTSNSNAVLGSATLSADPGVSTLTLTSSPTTTAEPYSIASGDFNNDGLADLVVPGEYASGNPPPIAILLSNGNGTFTNKSSPVAGNQPQTPVVGDFNNDGNLDFAVTDYEGGTLTVLLGKGDGTFTALAPITLVNIVVSLAAASCVAVGDVNGDGNLDLVVEVNNGTLMVFLGKGDGTFTAVTPSITTPIASTFNSTGLAIVDLKGNGVPDIVYTDNSTNTITILDGNGDGTFTSQATYPVVNQPSSLVVGDFNGDGILDLATSSGPIDAISVLLGNGDGTFTVSSTLLPTAGTPSLLAGADFNGDGILDLVTQGSAANSFRLLIGNGDGTFTPQMASYTSSSDSTTLYALAVGDFNGDGTIDVASVDGQNSFAAVMLNQVVSSATAIATGVSVPGGGMHMAEASYPGDVLYGASKSSTVTLDVPMTATALSLIAFPSTGTYGIAPALRATVSPYNSGTLTTNGETVTFYNDGAVIGTGTLASGVATFTALGLSVGANTLTASYGGDTNFTASNSPPLAYMVLPPTLASTTTLAATVNGVAVNMEAVGTTVTFTATVSANGQPVHPGQVRFCNALAACTGSGLLGISALQANGTASLALRLGIGPHTVRAQFIGTRTYSGSSSGAAPLTVTGFHTTAATLVSSGTTGNYTLTATVTGSGITAAPSGSVQFLDASNGGALLGTAALSPGTAVRNFRSLASPATGNKPSSIVTADFNRDGIPDAAVVNTGDNTVTALLGKGDGTMNALPSISLGGTGVFQTIAADFNGDGIPDLAVVCSGGSNTVTILLGKGDGTFTVLAGPAVSSPTAIAAGDFNLDGVPDLAIATLANNVLVWLGKGDGTFTAAASPSTTGKLPSSIAAGDYNGDGIPDVAVANTTDGNITVLLGNGDGTFLPQAAPVTAGSQPVELLTQDVNGDGFLDLVAVNRGGGTLSILLGSGTGSFTLKSSPSAGSAPVAAVLTDVNGDGNVDIVVADSGTPGQLAILLGKGDGTFTAQSSPPAAGSNPDSLAVADFNGDGLPDLIAADSGAPMATVLLSQIATPSTASLTGVSAPGAGTHNVEAGYSGDVNYSGSTSVTVPLTGSAVTTALVLRASTIVNSFGEAVTLAALLAPFSSEGVTTDGETVTFFDGATAIGTGTLTNGLATFSSGSLAVGMHSLTANYAGDAIFQGSVTPPLSYRVTAAAPVSTITLALSANGSPVTTVSPGTVVTMTATVTGMGNPLTPGTVTFCNATATFCSGLAVLGTGQLNSNGVAFAKWEFGPGAYQIAARFAGNRSFGASLSAPVPLSVPAVTQTAITATGVTGDYTLTGTVSSQASLISPAGTVSFLDTSNGNAAFASANLTPGVLTQQFAAGLPVPLPANALTITGDFYNDGLPAIFYYFYLSASYGGIQNDFGVVGNNPDGTFFQDSVSDCAILYDCQPNGFFVTKMAAGDFNNDGRLDVVGAGYDANNCTAALAAANGCNNTILIMIEESGGTGYVRSLGPSFPDLPVGVVSGDFNGDGNLDVIVTTGSFLAPANYFLAGNGNGTFAAPVLLNNLTVGSTNPPYPFQVADFNRDGVLDLAIVAQDQGTVFTFLGNGDGTFGTPVTTTIPKNSISPLVIADFNGDGLPDFALQAPNAVEILLGNGDGTFTIAPVAPPTGGAGAVVAADFNGDGKTDLAVLNSSTVWLIPGNGDGTFRTATMVSVATPYPASLIAGDFNGDGLPDLITASSNSTYAGNEILNSASYSASAVASNVNVPGAGVHLVDASYPGNNASLASVSGTVALTPVISTNPTAPTAIALSRDPATAAFGSTVILTATLTPHAAGGANTDGETISFLLNNAIVGSGTLSGGVATFSTTTLPLGDNSLTAAYNGDTSFSASVSAPVIYIVTPASVAISLMLTAGGKPVSTVPFPTAVSLTATVSKAGAPFSPGMVRFCDAAYVSCQGSGLLGETNLNANGMASLILTLSPGSHTVYAVFERQTSYGVSTSLNASITVTGALSDTTLAAAGESGAYTLTASTAGFGLTTGPTGAVSFLDTTNHNAVLGTAALGSATGGRSFVSEPPLVLSGDNPVAVVRLDANGDGIPDLAILDWLNDEAIQIIILLGKGDGTFTQLPSFTPSAPSNVSTLGWYMTAGDFNQDGISDLAVSTSNGAIVLLGNGDGTFTFQTLLAFNAQEPLTSVFSADFNGDGYPDILSVSGEYALEGASLFPGNGDGTFAAPIHQYLYSSQAVPIVVVGDFNGDGYPDELSVNSLGVWAYLNNGSGSFATTVSTPVSFASLGYSAATGDFNGDGILDVVVSAGSYSVLLGNGDGTFTPVASSPALASGLHGLTTGDFNRDGLDDIASVNSSGMLTVFLSNGDGTFTAQAPIAVSPGGIGLSSAIVTGDFNRDGQIDIAVANDTNDDVQLLFNRLAETAVAYLPNIVIPVAGSHQVQAVYGGDSNYAAGSPSNTITLTGVPATPLNADVSSLSFTLPYQGAASPQTIHITSPSGAVNFNVASDSAWLGAPAGGATPTPLIVTATPGSMPVGFYNGDLTLTAGISTLKLPVTLEVELAGTLCDVNSDGVVNLLDIQKEINEALGGVSPANDQNKDGAVNAVDVQIEMNAVLGLGCSAR